MEKAAERLMGHWASSSRASSTVHTFVGKRFSVKQVAHVMRQLDCAAVTLLQFRVMMDTLFGGILHFLDGVTTAHTTGDWQFRQLLATLRL